MNKAIIRYILGYVLKIEAAFLLLSALVGLIYGEKEGFAFLITALVSIIIGQLMTFKKPASSVFYLKEGCIATSLAWIVLSIFGALPFVINGDIPSFTDALFETVSGFTTTGTTILNDVEALSHCSLFWRSFTHWIGGMGVLVFLLAIVPLSGGSNINLMKAESPGPSVGKLVPKLRYTARILYIIYVVMTLVQIILLSFDMPIFDALTLSFGTAGTGGFGIKNDSIASYSAYSQWVITIFMILFGVNFNAYYLILFKKFKQAFSIEEVRWYFIIIGMAILTIFISLKTNNYGDTGSIRHVAFQVASIITSTGYSTVDFDLWTETAKTILIFIMFIGACAGSTGGGIKVSRFLIGAKSILRELNSYIHPKSIKQIKVDGKPIDNSIVHSVGVYFVTFIIIFGASVLLISFDGMDFTTNFTAITATLNNIGPGLSLAGPTESFSCFSAFSKYVIMFDMLAGRLEFFPLLLLFHPVSIKEWFSKR